MAMSKKYQRAAQNLHDFVSDTSNLSDSEVRETLKAEGVDVAGFLARLGKESGLASAKQSAQPSASERLRALANRAGDGMKKLLGEAEGISSIPGTSAAYGRKGKSRANNKRGNRASKQKR
jgi:hypothetical protein